MGISNWGQQFGEYQRNAMVAFKEMKRMESIPPNKYGEYLSRKRQSSNTNKKSRGKRR